MRNENEKQALAKPETISLPKILNSTIIPRHSFRYHFQPSASNPIWRKSDWTGSVS